MKTASSELEAANKMVPKIDVADGIEKHKEGKSVFIDVRDGLEINKSGTIKGALGSLEASLSLPQIQARLTTTKIFKEDADIVLVCGAGYGSFDRSDPY